MHICSKNTSDSPAGTNVFHPRSPPGPCRGPTASTEASRNSCCAFLAPVLASLVAYCWSCLALILFCRDNITASLLISSLLRIDVPRFQRSSPSVAATRTKGCAHPMPPAIGPAPERPETPRAPQRRQSVETVQPRHILFVSSEVLK